LYEDGIILRETEAEHNIETIYPLYCSMAVI